MAEPKKQNEVKGESALEALRQASEGLLFLSETDAPIEPFFWAEAAPVAPSSELVAARAKVEAKEVKAQSLTAFFKGAVREEDWQNAEEKAQAKRFQLLLDAVKHNLDGAKAFRVGEIEIAVYVVGRVGDGYAGFQTKVVET